MKAADSVKTFSRDTLYKNYFLRIFLLWCWLTIEYVECVTTHVSLFIPFTHTQSHTTYTYIYAHKQKTYIFLRNVFKSFFSCSQSRLIPFMIANFVVVKIRCEPLLWHAHRSEAICG